MYPWYATDEKITRKIVSPINKAEFCYVPKVLFEGQTANCWQGTEGAWLYHVTEVTMPNVSRITDK